MTEQRATSRNIAKRHRSLFWVLVCLCFVVLIPKQLVAQEKRETEYKIPDDQAPAPAREWIDKAYNQPTRVSWYREDHSGELSFEAKFRWEKRWHSVKFSPEGNIEDIEIRIKKKEIPATARDKIWAYFDTTYTKYRVNKIQLQWTGGEKQLLKALQEHNASGVTTKYEIEFMGRNAEENDLWEGLFDKTGVLLQRSRIILIPTDNLAY